MSHPEAQEELLSPAEVAALLYVDPETVTRWAAAGKLAAVRTPSGHRRYLRSEVLAIVSGLHPDRRARPPREVVQAPDRPIGQPLTIVPSPRAGDGVEVASERQVAAAAIVGAAVSLALETAADEAAEAALLASAAVSKAACRAAEAAESAREVRASAAQAAAQSVAWESERTAERMRDHAAQAAARVQDAASLAADELARCIEGGLAPDAGHIAELLAATVSAAADAMKQDTAQAADAAKNAESAAAAQVLKTLAAAEDLVEREVTATADAQRELAAATALAVALETDAHAAGIALAAGEAAVALLTDELWARTVDLKADLGEHELATVVREVRASDRAREMAEILAAAAAMDRIYAMTDPAASTSDRAKISVHPSSKSEAWGLREGGSISEAAAELSHDLRVPLSSIIASVEMLEDELRDHAGGSIPALLGRATRAGDRMVRMLDQNMTLGAEGSSPTRSEVDLNEVVRQLLLDSANLLEPLGAVVEAGTLPVVRADPDGMYSVLQNLLGNAVKFARPGVPARVRVSARRSNDGWRISVRDNGVGLPQEVGLDMFSLFSRGTTTVTGHGIGLATVGRIVAGYGGRVGFTTVQTGAKVWFEMPEDETAR
ncbi:hypothetical protein GCM10027020_09670 [Nocardioides salsibiostraticola]